MMTTLWTGRRLVIMPQFEPRAWLDLVERERITHAFVVPTMMKHLLDQPDLERRDLASLEVLSYGGAPMPFPVIRRAIERFPKSVGLRERLRPDRDDVDAHRPRPRGSPPRRRRRPRSSARCGACARSAGRCPTSRCGSSARRARRSPPSEVGEIHVRTPRAMKGYAGARGLAVHGRRLAADARPGLDRRGRLPLRRRAARTT